jgi:hypothetical protein
LWLAPYRALDSQFGRWVIEDPSFDIYDRLNLFSYVANNPTGSIEPDGLYTVTPGVPRPSPEIDAFLKCLESLLKVALFVTSTSDSRAETDPHTHGMAVDVRSTGNFE